MSKNLNNAKIINILAIASLSCIIGFIVVIVITWFLPVLFVSVGLLVFLSILIWFLLIAGIVLSFVTAIMILAIDWKLESLQTPKLLWGLLALLLLGPIASLIFANVATKVLKDQTNDDVY